MKLEAAVTSLAALASESRLELFRLLVKRGPEGYTPNEIAEKLDISGSTLSFHLKELTKAGLIKPCKESRFIYYSPDFSEVDQLMDFLTEHCCSLSDKDCCITPAAKAKTKSTARKASK
ncbi:MAG TPA: metalloregulator ArsR/SmtB family transcription factor [Steroidobacteraceae bacterium]|jgi:DNA-binding transcriptional ArsR family regulator|nr:metalloregulator ArsR/SmtB family transcription factor [Steroidobacteraceae bacterium]